ncbi:KGK domain-containing protein [Cyanobacterium aponinum]|uniref:KGK family protein n=1 Tax=Cyanobacterium aponinum (strain PCC 10605) TaxID=755178 RepID=K9Z5D5_CYAAP|nr:KGK domain-containing protein [Cyanobacterium aponinum]AFZ54396.1 KGK family protein [Cyanobacterium aponinum PCC 10605]
MDQKIEHLEKNDVIQMKKDKSRWVMKQTTFTVNDFISTLSNCYISDAEAKEWCNNGVEAEVLVPRKPWRKGKIRLSIEFIPDESEIESPLDDFRQKTNL